MLIKQERDPTKELATVVMKVSLSLALVASILLNNFEKVSTNLGP